VRGGSLGNGEGRGGGRNRKRLNRPDPTLVKTGITDVPAAILYMNNSHHIPDVQTKENASITSIRRRDVSAIILPLCIPSCSSALPPQPSFAMMLVPSSSPAHTPNPTFPAQQHPPLVFCSTFCPSPLIVDLPPGPDAIEVEPMLRECQLGLRR